MKSLFDPELVTAICARLSTGEPLAQICRDEGMPDPSTVWRWAEKDAETSQAIARAREDGFDQIAMDALRIADTPQEGIIEKLELVKINDPNNIDAPQTTELQVTERRREDMLGHRKLQIETRLKLLAKWDPKRYGEKLQTELTGANGGPIAVSLGLSESAQIALRRLARGGEDAPNAVSGAG